MTKAKRKGTRSESGRLDNLFSWRRAILEATAEELPPTRAHCLLVLSCHMNDAGDGCWPSQGRLAAETKLTRRAVQIHLAAAEEAGWIQRRVVTRDGKVTGTIYRAAIPQAVWERMTAEPSPEADADLDGESGSPFPEDDAPEAMANDVRHGGESRTPRGEPRSPGWRTTFAGMANDVRPNSSENSSGNSSERKKAPASPDLSLPGGPAGSGQVSTPDPVVPAPPSAPPSAPAMPPFRRRVILPEVLDRIRDAVNRALGYTGTKAALPAEISSGRWDRIAVSCDEDPGIAAKAAVEAMRRVSAAGWPTVTLRYFAGNIDELVGAALTPKPAVQNLDARGEETNDAFLARMKAQGGAGA